MSDNNLSDKIGKLKCPKCGGRLVYWGATGALLKCSQCKFGWGNRELWQELINTKKKLDIAVDALEKIGSGDIIEHSIVGHEDDNKIFIANKAIEQIKDNDKDVK